MKKVNELQEKNNSLEAINKLRFLHNPPASEVSRGVYWNQVQKNFPHPYSEDLYDNGTRTVYIWLKAYDKWTH